MRGLVEEWPYISGDTIDLGNEVVEGWPHLRGNPSMGNEVVAFVEGWPYLGLQ